MKSPVGLWCVVAPYLVREMSRDDIFFTFKLANEARNTRNSTPQISGSDKWKVEPYVKGK